MRYTVTVRQREPHPWLVFGCLLLWLSFAWGCVYVL